MLCTGVEAGKLQKIGGANKRCWKHIEDTTSQTWRTVEKSQVPSEAWRWKPALFCSSAECRSPTTKVTLQGPGQQLQDQQRHHSGSFLQNSLWNSVIGFENHNLLEQKYPISPKFQITDLQFLDFSLQIRHLTIATNTRHQTSIVRERAIQEKES
jgi:hypothetical protein